MSRMVNWSTRYDDSINNQVATAKVNPRWCANINLSFTIEYGRYGGLVNKNAVLLVRKAVNGSKVANTVLLKREFKASWVAKSFLDNLLGLANIMYDSNNEFNAEKWVLEQLSNYPGAPIPEQPETVTNYMKMHPRGRIW